MKNFYALLLFGALSLTATVNVNAQNYRPMAVENAHWIVKYGDGISS